ncbi:unnamed protein product [Lactuca virosa]|uniref:VQ domain-containing protein n=1 Tax=Lactuca virosa TaxID=75947 RepID=A0AAU9MP18_9ASTR|nr:unnamed protein product [Lactuca virosa]
MDQYSYSSSSSLSSSSGQQQYAQKTIKSSRPLYHNSLHSVRKSLQKPITKHFIAPLQPTPPKVYDVDVSSFKEVVRVLTCSPEFQQPSPRRLKDMAPPALIISTIPKPSLFPKPSLLPQSEEGGALNKLPTFIMSPGFCKYLNETLDTTRFISESPEMIDCFGGLSQAGLDFSMMASPNDLPESTLISPLDLSLSPTSLSWCSSLILSPL